VAELIQHSIMTKHLKDDKDEITTEVIMQEFKTAAAKDRIKTQQENKTQLRKQKSKYCKAEKRSTKIESRAKLLVYRKIQAAKETFHAGPSQYFKRGLLVLWENHCLCNSFKISESVSKTKVIQKWPNT
jgi:hypothetical protein